MYKFEKWTWCRCWLPLLGIEGGGVHTLADWTWCRCWLPLLSAIAGLPLLAAIAGDGGGGCRRWRIGRGGVPLMGAIAGCHCWAAIAGCHCWDRGGWVYKLADWMW